MTEQPRMISFPTVLPPVDAEDREPPVEPEVVEPVVVQGPGKDCGCGGIK